MKRAPILQELRQCQSGMAMIEFAFAAPILLTVVMAGLELTNLAVAHLRVSQMAMTVADNAGRVTTGIDETQIYEVFAGAELIGEPIDFEDHGRIVLSSLEPNGLTGGNAGQMIRWQRCWGDMDVDPAYGVQGAGSTNATLVTGMGAVGNRIIAGTGTAVMFVEVTYDYQPVIASAWISSPQIRYETAFNVRGRENNVITNTQALTVMTCA